MERSLQIFMFFPALYFKFRLLHQLYLWPRHIHNFILYLISNTSLMYFEFATLLNCKSHSLSQRPDSDVYLLSQTWQGLVPPVFQLNRNLTCYLSWQIQLMGQLTEFEVFSQEGLLIKESTYFNSYLRVLYHTSISR